VVADDATAYINSYQVAIEVKGEEVQIHSEHQEKTLKGKAPFTVEGEAKTLQEFINYLTTTID
jgi:diaminopimelate epimerase